MGNADSRLEHQGLLEDLVRLRKPVGVAAAAVRGLPFDADAVLVTVTKADVTRALTAFISGTLSVTDLETWSQAIEVREDLDLESDAREPMRQFLFEASTPELFGVMTPEAARGWVETFA